MKNKTRRIIGIVLQAPLVGVVIVSFFISIYLAYNKMMGITYGSSVISGIILVLYFTGVILMVKKDSEKFKK